MFDMANHRTIGITVLLVVVSATAWGDAAPSDKPSDPVQVAVDRLAAMEPAQQQAWLKRLEDRAGRAARLMLKPAEAEKLQADVHARLYQKTVAWETIRDVIEETDAREKDAIKSLAGDYRRQVFEVFHTDLHDYADRQRAWLNLDKQWKEAGRPFEPQDRLIDWLEAAIQSASPARAGAIPPPPSLKVEPIPPKVAKKPQEKPRPAPATKPPAIAKAQQPPRQTSVENVAKPQSAVAPEPPKKPQPEPKPEPKPKVVFPPMPTLEASVAPLERSAAEPPLNWPKGEPEAPPVALRRVESSPVAPPTVEELHFAQRKPRSLGELKPVISTDVLRQLAADASGTSEPTSPSVPESKPARNTVEVKIGELSARIGGCNLAFRAIEAELDDHRNWDAAKLEPLMDRLEKLVTRRRDLNLFREALTDAQRAQVDPLESEKGSVSQFAACIDAARKHAAGSQFNGTDAERQAEMQRLDRLSSQLDELVEK